MMRNIRSHLHKYRTWIVGAITSIATIGVIVTLATQQNEGSHQNPARIEDAGIVAYHQFEFLPTEDALDCLITIEYEPVEAIDEHIANHDAMPFPPLIMPIIFDFSRNGYPSATIFQIYGENPVHIFTQAACHQTEKIAKDFAKFATAYQKEWVFRIVNPSPNVLDLYQDQTLRETHGMSKEEWQARAQAIQRRCNPAGWRNLANWYGEEDRKRSYKPTPENVILLRYNTMHALADVLDGTPTEDAVQERFNSTETAFISAMISAYLERNPCRS